MSDIQVPKSAPAKPPAVAVVGGGIAGMTAALRLRQRGFEVTLFEEKDTLGGNVSSDDVNGVQHDVYPHMFCGWYANFWSLLEDDLGLSREKLFEPRGSVRYMHGGATDFCELKNATTPDAVWSNLKSGVLDPANMIVWGYSMLDLATHSFGKADGQQFNKLDVNGFLYSRGYITEGAAKLHDYLLTLIWSIQSAATAATCYKEFLRHTLTFPEDAPFCWLLKGPLSQMIIAPFEQKLGCEVRKRTEVTKVSLEGADGRPRVTSVATDPTGMPAAPVTEDFDYVVLAVPPQPLARLIMTGEALHRIVDHEPDLSDVQRLTAVPIPVVDVYFKHKLPGFPAEQIGFEHSKFGLSVVDISQLWRDDPDMEHRTALVVAASVAPAIPSLEPEERGFLIINDLYKAMPRFLPGDHWGDPKSDIDWSKTHYRGNDHHRLFVNDVDSWGSRPQASYPSLPRVAFAGDCCESDVDMATVEAAVQSGVLAAQAIQGAAARNCGEMLGEVITLRQHTLYSPTVLLAAKLMLMPAAYAATAWSAWHPDGRQSETPLGPDDYADTTATLLLPLQFTLDWWVNVYWLAKHVHADVTQSQLPKATAGVQDEDNHYSMAEVGSRILHGLGETLNTVAKRQPTRGEAAQPSAFGQALGIFADQAVKTAKAAFEVARAARPAPQTGSGPADAAAPRRARVKR